MSTKEPVTELNPSFSTADAEATPWSDARTLLEKAEVYWLATVHPDGQPNITPLLAIWLDDVFYFTTGEGERKAKNIAQNPCCTITTGCNVQKGTDIIVEGSAVQVGDDTLLKQLAELYASKYDWHYEVLDGAFHHEGGTAQVYRVAPVKAFSFGKGDTSSQTRYRF